MERSPPSCPTAAASGPSRSSPLKTFPLSPPLRRPLKGPPAAPGSPRDTCLSGVPTPSDGDRPPLVWTREEERRVSSASPGGRSTSVLCAPLSADVGDPDGCSFFFLRERQGTREVFRLARTGADHLLP